MIFLWSGLAFVAGALVTWAILIRDLEQAQALRDRLTAAENSRDWWKSIATGRDQGPVPPRPGIAVPDHGTSHTSHGDRRVA